MKPTLDFDLDMTVDEESWIKEHPVYCPAPWCNANKLRRARCGDVGGEYEGIHKCRIAYAASEAARVRKQLASLRRMGTREPENMLGMLRLMQDAVDTGLLPTGRRGRRRLV